LCTALQLTNFWQDLDRDWQNGRLYVPLDDVAAEGARTSDLDDRRMTEPWQRVLRRVAGRTQLAFGAGRDVCDGVRGRLRYELRCTWLGGVRILERLDRIDYDVFAHRPRLGAGDFAALVLGAVLWDVRRAPDGVSTAPDARPGDTGRDVPATKP